MATLFTPLHAYHSGSEICRVLLTARLTACYPECDHKMNRLYLVSTTCALSHVSTLAKNNQCNFFNQFPYDYAHSLFR